MFKKFDETWFQLDFEIVYRILKSVRILDILE